MKLVIGGLHTPGDGDDAEYPEGEKREKLARALHVCLIIVLAARVAMNLLRLVRAIRAPSEVEE